LFLFYSHIFLLPILPQHGQSTYQTILSLWYRKFSKFLISVSIQ
jgi:hypothetical protein